MNRTQNGKAFRTMHASEITPPMPDVTPVMSADDSKAAARSNGELTDAHTDPENSEILLAACRIVISGYKAEISRGQAESLFVQAAYQLLHHFLERQFADRSRAA